LEKQVDMKKAAAGITLLFGMLLSPLAQDRGPVDLILVLDTSSSMSGSYEDVQYYISGPFLRDFLRIGDTFHLISFAESPRTELARRIEGIGDVETIIGRMLLAYPLEPHSNITGALDYVETYIEFLPDTRSKKVVLVSDGEHRPQSGAALDAAALQNRISESSVRLRRLKADLQMIRVPDAVAGLAAANRPPPEPPRTAAAPPPSDASPSAVPPPARADQPPAPPPAVARPSEPSRTAAPPPAPARPAAEPVVRQREPSRPPAEVSPAPPPAVRQMEPGRTAPPSAPPSAAPPSRPPAEVSPAPPPAARQMEPGRTVPPSAPPSAAPPSRPPAAEPPAPLPAARQPEPNRTPAPGASPAAPPSRPPAVERAPAVPPAAPPEAAPPPARPAEAAERERTGTGAPPVPAAPEAPAEPSAATETPPAVPASQRAESGFPLALLVALGIGAALIILALVIYLMVRKLHYSPNQAMAYMAGRTVSRPAVNRDQKPLVSENTAENAKLFASFAAAQRRSSPPPKTREPKPLSYHDALMLTLFVEDQNTAIGRRNIHSVKPGNSYTIGGGNSDFLIFLVSLPPHIAELRFDGRQCTFTPKRPQFFPDLGAQILPNCLGQTVRIISEKNYELFIRVEQYEDPLTALNRLLRSIDLPG
jgi:hypothetical protein